MTSDRLYAEVVQLLYGYAQRRSLPESGPVEKWPQSVFTTAEAAKVCKVSQQTIVRCFDDGRLRGYREGRFRRIPREALREFMQRHGIPTDTLDD